MPKARNHHPRNICTECAHEHSAAFARVEAIVQNSTAKNDALAVVDDRFRLDSEFDEAEGIPPESKEEGIELV